MVPPLSEEAGNEDEDESDLHPPEPWVGEKGPSRHLRYLILLQSSGEGGDCLFSHQSFTFLNRPRFGGATFSVAKVDNDDEGAYISVISTGS